MYYLRVPNILGIEPKPFDPDTYEELRTDNDKSRNQNPETIARWRYATDDRGIVVVCIILLLFQEFSQNFHFFIFLKSPPKKFESNYYLYKKKKIIL